MCITLKLQKKRIKRKLKQKILAADRKGKNRSALVKEEHHKNCNINKNRAKYLNCQQQFKKHRENFTSKMKTKGKLLQRKTERIHYQELCSAKNVKGSSSWGRK